MSQVTKGIRTERKLSINERTVECHKECQWSLETSKVMLPFSLNCLTYENKSNCQKDATKIYSACHHYCIKL